MNLICANCGKKFVASRRQEKTTRFSKKWKPRHGFSCSRQCTSALGVRFRKQNTPLPLDKLARNRLNQAVIAGTLTRPGKCERCGSEPPRDRLGRSRIHGHHPNHNDSLTVEWLCYLCHIAITPAAKGERASKAVFTVKEVKQIRELANAGQTGISIARQFGVTRKAIYDIIHRRSWRQR